MQIKVYTIKEAAKILGVHRTFVSRLIHRGELKAIQIGRIFRILEEDLEQFAGDFSQGLLKIEEAAKILKIHPFYILRLIKKNDLKALKLGNSYRLRSLDLDSFLGENVFQKFLTVDEVAKLLFLSRATILELIKNKKLKSFRLGKFYRVSEKNLKEFLRVKEVA